MPPLSWVSFMEGMAPDVRSHTCGVEFVKKFPVLVIHSSSFITTTHVVWDRVRKRAAEQLVRHFPVETFDDFG